MTTPQDDRPVELEGVPNEENIDTADAVERLDLDPEEQPNRTDEQLSGDEVPGR